MKLILYLTRHRFQIAAALYLVADLVLQLQDDERKPTRLKKRRASKAMLPTP
jgi:hypothetical protein